MQAGRVDRIARDIRRVLAPNPSAMTGPGTNSYLLGRGAGVILVDPGPDDPAHLASLHAALDPGEAIAAIIVTHAHKDHSAAAPRLSAQTGAPVLAFGDAYAGRSPLMEQLAQAGLSGGGEGTDTRFRPDRTLHDGQTLPCGDTLLRIIHTPGHMAGHICLALGDVLLSGDHAMGWASSLISPPDGDMGAYMTSLARLARTHWALMLPGHGPEVTEVAARLQALTTHRQMREAEVLTALSAAPATPATLTRAIYHSIPPALHAAAERNVLAHLIDLAQRNLVTCQELPASGTIFTRCDPK
ncbi:MBL fold metallo-hydrolase [Pseudotabrizicola algicola]|uniref:MBL fold metallo-hydrolase n=1 Tax=Pseudotabrizicola algicola TaxID=2709381 RepID=A0A6B3RH89_9RHOB|nr:MBL fold metallo-hydrolase [Pseudotabrizicola algicola]NEX44606.1 MBL fold metallo-hydrolase [Pseudotabrizicola algicola]